MKKAVVVGGSNGIGLALAINLLKKNYYVIIIDKSYPDELHSNENIQFIKTNLLNYESNLFIELSKDTSIGILLITAGIGRVARFTDLSESEIHCTLSVNAEVTIQIIKCFEKRIFSYQDFFCGVITSIAGLISSPLFSVYAASKAATHRYLESVNIELEVNGTTNRILEIAPLAVPGTKFSGGENRIDLIESLAENIIIELMKKSTIYIPDYECTVKNILNQYVADPHEFGLSSYQYKLNNKRLRMTPCIKVGYLSGTFDLFHIGHLNIIKKAKENCDFLIVGVHSNGNHKGKKTFVPLDERKAILSSVKYVDMVVDSCAEDSDAWKLYNYDILFVGSDYKNSDRFLRYEEFFSDKNVSIVYFPYTNTTSSTQIRKAIELQTSSLDSVNESKNV